MRDFTILRIREDLLEDGRSGRLHPRVVIEAPDWVNVLALTRSDEVVMVRQFRAGVARDTLELPGGMIDAGEDPERAGLRELEEETGYRAGRVVTLGACEPNPALQSNRLHTFLALDCERLHAGRPEDGEDIRVELVARAALPALVRDGAITHALVLAAFQLATLHGALP